MMPTLALINKIGMMHTDGAADTNIQQYVHALQCYNVLLLLTQNILTNILAFLCLQQQQE